MYYIYVIYYIFFKLISIAQVMHINSIGLSVVWFSAFLINFQVRLMQWSNEHNFE